MRYLGLYKIALAFLLVTSLLGPLILHERRLLSDSQRLVHPCQGSNATVWITRFPKAASNNICLSRNEHSYWKSPSEIHAISPALRAALSRYEKFHASCYNGRDLEETLLRPNPRDTCKYVVHSEVDGLGNRLLTLASAFTYALLTNRVLLIESRGHLSKLLCEPFNHTSWLLPADFPYEVLDRAPSLRNGHLHNQQIVRVRLMNVQSSRDQQFFRQETRSRLQDVRWIIWSSNLYYVPRFFTLPEFWQPLLAWFPEVSLAFTQLSKYLILPENYVWDKLLRLHSSYLSPPGKLVGLQVRLHHRGDPGAFHPATNDRVLECLVQSKLLPPLARNTTESELSYDRGKQAIIKVLVTSLQVQYYEELKRAYMNHPSWDGSLIRIETLSHDGVQSESLEQAVNAMVEMWLLSFSDELVTSSCSTFGYVAQGIAGIRPRILNIQGDDVEGCGVAEACSVGQSVEPCNHYPFFREWEKDEISAEQRRWMRLHIKGCQDEVEGVQLVSNPISKST